MFIKSEPCVLRRLVQLEWLTEFDKAVYFRLAFFLMNPSSFEERVNH